MVVIKGQNIIHSRRFQEFLKSASSEEVELKQLSQLLEADTEAAEELEVAEQKVSNQGHIDLSHDCILGVSDKGFDLQILLDEAEEGLDLPAFLVDIGDSPGGEVEVVGQKDVVLAGRLVPVADPAQSGRVVVPFGSGQLDNLVGGDAQATVGLVPLDDPVACFGFHFGYEENALVSEGK